MGSGATTFRERPSCRFNRYGRVAGVAGLLALLVGAGCIQNRRLKVAVQRGWKLGVEKNWYGRRVSIREKVKGQEERVLFHRLETYIDASMSSTRRRWKDLWIEIISPVEGREYLLPSAAARAHYQSVHSPWALGDRCRGKVSVVELKSHSIVLDVDLLIAWPRGGQTKVRGLYRYKGEN